MFEQLVTNMPVGCTSIVSYIMTPTTYHTVQDKARRCQTTIHFPSLFYIKIAFRN